MGLLALPFKNKQILLAIVAVNTIVMAGCSIFLIYALLHNGVGISKAHTYLAISASKYVQEGMLIADLLLLVIFVVLGVKIKSLIMIGLGVLQLAPLAFFELYYLPKPFEAGPAFALDYLSLVFVLICSIVGSVIAIYGVQYMADEHKQGRFFSLRTTWSSSTSSGNARRYAATS